MWHTPYKASPNTTICVYIQTNQPNAAKHHLLHLRLLQVAEYDTAKSNAHHRRRTDGLFEVWAFMSECKIKIKISRPNAGPGWDFSRLGPDLRSRKPKAWGSSPGLIIN